MRRHCWVLVAAAILAGCAAREAPQRAAALSVSEPALPAVEPLLYDEAEIARSDTLAILVPGALASIGIFAPAEDWRARGYALVYYRFPGMDGLPLDRDLKIAGAAAHISAFAARHPGKKLRLVGYSTGGAIVLTAARDLRHRDLRVAAISPSPARRGGLRTTLAAAADVIAAATRAGTTDREAVWLEYFRTLLYGRPGLRDPALAERSRQLVQELRDRIATPDARMVRSHSGDLRRWQPGRSAREGAPNVRIYTGQDDPVFSVGQTRALARQVGGAEVFAYPENGHLLLVTAPRVFDDIFAFFEADGSAEAR